jgi:IPT/TIG domain-containing protein/flagellar hook capping protein FlgD
LPELQAVTRFGLPRLPADPRAFLAGILALSTLLGGGSLAVSWASTPVTVGYRDFDFGATVGSTPTGEKPESKLWWNDGLWWGVLWSPSSNAFTIQRFNPAVQDWVNTGVAVDSRGSSKSDALWDGTKLYVVTHIFTLNPGPAGGAGNAARLYRYSYNASTDTYSLDSGFPATINDSKSECLVLDKDSTGRLWITWVENGKVKVNRSTTNDLTWGTPFNLPVQGSGNLDVDEISSVVAFGGNKIGIMWSNQTSSPPAGYFAVHLDGTADTTWQARETAVQDASLGLIIDDHISLKASCAADGALYAATKTGLTGSNPLNYVLKRTSAGVWSRHVWGTGSENHTRAILNIDADANRAYVFSMSDQSGRYIIYMKSASLTDLQFPGGLGTPIIDSPGDLKTNNVTSTKQCVNGASGLLLLASDQDTHYYLHNFIDLSGTAPAISSFTPGSGVIGTQVTITGARFSGATSVTFNGTPSSYVVQNSTLIRANVPAGATTGPIRITTPSGIGTSSTNFTVIIPPTVTAFSPTSGPVGATVTVFGTGFATTSAVRFNNVAASFSVTSDTSLTSPVPAGATTGSIIVTSSTGSDTSATSFTVIQLPTIASFSPTTGPGGSEVTVRGTSFASATAVKFNGIAASFTVDSTTGLRANVPGGFTAGPISVTNPAGTGTSAGNFTVSGPVITGFNPTTGMAGTQIAIDGSGFLSTTAVAFNGAQASFVIDSNVRLRVIVPSAATTGKITVTSPDGTAQSAANFIPVLPPSISSFTPDRGSIGSSVAIRGHDFYGVTLVTFNGTSASGYTVNSDSMITATVPTGATTGPISVTASGGIATSNTSFLVLGPPPTQTFSPAHDTQVNSGSPNTSFGTTNELRVRNSSPNYYSFLKFNVIGLGSSVRKATLRLYCTDESPDGGAIYLVSNDYLSTTTPWVETGLTYNNAPAMSGAPIAATKVVTTNAFVEYDVTLPNMVDGTYSFGMKNTSTNSAFYSSKEATTVANRPVLIVESNVSPAIGSFTPTSGQAGTSVTVRGTGFTGATSVTFNGTSASYTVNSDTVITTPVPAGAPSGPIRVTNSVGSSTSTGYFTVIVAPAISSFSPATGPVGMEVTVHGVGFYTANTFRFNGIAAFFTIVNDTTLRAIVPGGSSSGPLSVVNTLGSAFSTGSFTVIKPPTITSFNPGSGPAGTEVTIRGKNYGTASAVAFNGTLAAFTADNDSTLRANVPAGASSGAITATNPAGTGASTTNFTVVTTPTIVSFNPTQGPVGNQVTVIGSHFTGASAVKFNGTLASFAVTSDTSLITTVPSGSSSGPISVTNQVGTVTSLGSFTVILPPTIASFHPTSGPMGTVVTVLGSRFTTASAVKFNGTSAAFTVDNDTTLHATVPNGVGTGTISVTNPAGTATSAASFTVIVAPTIGSFAPDSGGTGAVVEIQGTGFTYATAIRFNGTNAVFSVDSDGLAHATLPAGASSGPITVTNPAGTATSAGSFTVIPLPSISSFNPLSGPVGAQVTVRGSRFNTVTAVRFNGTNAFFAIDNDTTLRASVPAAATTGPISVTNMVGTATSAASFTVIAPPTIASFNPASGPVGAQITIQGTGFSTASAVRFNGTVAASFAIDSDTQLRASVPAGATSGPISVTNVAGATSSGSSFAVIQPPAITSFQPASAPTGAQVTVHGTSFATATAVRFNGNAAAFSVDNDTTLRATVPAGAGAGPISVTNPAGTAISAASFTVIPPPTITFFAPTSGPAGAQVTVHGTSFTSASAVKFNGTTAVFSVVSDTLLNANVPAGSSSGPISVTNPASTSSSAASFTVIAAPTVASFAPTSGPVGIEVTVQGTSFTTASAVKFNGTTAAFTVDGDTQLRATVPAGASSGVIAVTNVAGTASSAGSFAVIAPPGITTFNPASGPIGLQVTVHGSSFTTASAVRFNGTAAVFTVDGDTQLRATVPSGATSGPISVTNPAATATSAASFTVNPPPTVTSFNPTSGQVMSQVTVRGSSFTTASAVRFNGTSASFTVDSDTSLRATVPATATSGPITVVNVAGTGTSASSFVVLRPPTITTFNPNNGPVGIQVTVQGTGFSGATAVKFNGTTASYLIDSDTQLRATVPAGATSGPISVSNPMGTFTSGPSFTVLPPPTITTFNPVSGPVGTQVTVRGTRFNGASAVQFNGTAAVYTVDSDTTLRATVPNGATTGPIAVTSSTGTATSAASFTVINPPTITFFTPGSGPVGAQVTVHGSSFTTASAVRFNGSAAVYTIESDTLVRATVPAGAGSGPISVTNPSGTYASAASFTVIPPPTVTVFSPASGPVGIQVTVRGTSFNTAAAVKFNGTAAVFSVVSDTLLHATVPAAASSGPISVTNAASTAASAAGFTVIPPPTISTFSPSSGPAETEVTVHGTSFTTASAVRFNGTSAASFAIDNDTQLRATVPFGASSGPISVTNVAGTANSAAFTVLLPPTITGFNPASGAVGTVVTVQGSGFGGSSAVRFNGTAAGFVVDNDTQLRATVPSGASSGPISVTNATGTFTSGPSFTVIPPPAVASFNPASGPVGTEVTLHGSSFTGASAVKFNGTSATSFAVDNDTQLRATVPAGAGSGPISVTNVAGTTGSAASFTVIAPPTILSFAPGSGPAGTEVTVRGTSFTSATAVRFNGTTAVFTVASDTVLRANVPAGASSGPISVTNVAGSAVSAASFTVLLPPSISAFDPNSGIEGTEVTIYGSGFDGTTAVKFNGAAAVFTVNSDVLLRASVPVGATSGPISITNATGTFTSGPSFTVIPPPVITSFTPASGPVASQVTVHGRNFTGASAVKFNGTAAVFTVDSDTLLHATVPNGAGSGTISVTGPGGTATSAASFTVLVPPTITSFTPTSGPVGTQVTVNGTGFSGTTSVQFNGSAASFTVVSSTRLHATVPAGAGSGPISVGNPTGTFASGSSFTVIAAPTVASFSPTSGTPGTEVTVHGTGFIAASAVRFNGTPWSFTVDSDTVLHATVPPGATSGPISVTNPAGTALSATNFVVIVPPTISSFSPGSGPVGSEVTLHGSSFASASVVKFNGTTASNLTVISDTVLHATVPAGASSGPVSVTNAAGTGTSAGNFTVLLPPSVTAFNPASGPVGTEVTIQGTGFGGAIGVEFNGSDAEFIVESSTLLRATVPAGASSGRISVSSLAGTGSSAASFTVIVPPTITSFTPASGAVGIQVTIHGSSFATASVVKFNGTTASNMTVLSDTVLHARVPVGAGSGPISVTNVAGTASSAGSFTVSGSPAISSFTPTSAPVGAVVTVHGISFTAASGVDFHGTPAAAFTVDSDTKLRATVPAGATSGPISVTNVAGTGTSAASFTVIATPAISAFTPTSGPVGSEVTVRGSSFAAAAEVRFNGALASTFMVDSDTTLRAMVPAGATSGPISVINPAGTATSAASFTVTVIVPPAITAFTPSTGPVGAEVTIQGTGFAATSAVAFNGTAAVFSVEGDTVLRATVPQGATSGPISVTNPAGSATTETSFIVNGTVGVDGDGISGEFALGRNYPNPFRARTAIDFELPRSARVRLAIYDLVGRAVRTLVDERLSAGVHQVTWDARDNSGRSVSSGIYLLRFEAEGRILTRRLMRAR